MGQEYRYVIKIDKDSLNKIDNAISKFNETGDNFGKNIDEIKEFMNADLPSNLINSLNNTHSNNLNNTEIDFSKIDFKNETVDEIASITKEMRRGINWLIFKQGATLKEFKELNSEKYDKKYEHLKVAEERITKILNGVDYKVKNILTDKEKELYDRLLEQKKSAKTVFASKETKLRENFDLIDWSAAESTNIKPLVSTVIKEEDFKKYSKGIANSLLTKFRANMKKFPDYLKSDFLNNEDRYGLLEMQVNFAQQNKIFADELSKKYAKKGKELSAAIPGSSKYKKLWEEIDKLDKQAIYTRDNGRRNLNNIVSNLLTDISKEIFYVSEFSTGDIIGRTFTNKIREVLSPQFKKIVNGYDINDKENSLIEQLFNVTIEEVNKYIDDKTPEFVKFKDKIRKSPQLPKDALKMLMAEMSSAELNSHINTKGDKFYDKTRNEIQEKNLANFKEIKEFYKLFQKNRTESFEKFKNNLDKTLSEFKINNYDEKVKQIIDSLNEMPITDIINIFDELDSLISNEDFINIDDLYNKTVLNSYTPEVNDLYNIPETEERKVVEAINNVATESAIVKQTDEIKTITNKLSSKSDQNTEKIITELSSMIKILDDNSNKNSTENLASTPSHKKGG